MDNYSLSDIAAAVNDNNGGFGGTNAWVLIILFAMIFGTGGFGWGGNRQGDYGQYATAASQQDILFSSKFSDLDNKIDRLGNGIADATFALNNSIKDGNSAVSDRLTNEGRGIQMQLANCCCENQKNTDALRYDISQMIASTNANTTAQSQKILDALTTNRMADMQNQINQLQLQNAMCGVVRYPMMSAYASNNPYCGGHLCNGV